MKQSVYHNDQILTTTKFMKFIKTYGVMYENDIYRMAVPDYEWLLTGELKTCINEKNCFHFKCLADDFLNHKFQNIIYTMYLPKSVETIGNRCFANSNLIYINLDNVTTIGDNAFSYCTKLEELKFHDQINRFPLIKKSIIQYLTSSINEMKSYILKYCTIGELRFNNICTQFHAHCIMNCSIKYLIIEKNALFEFKSFNNTVIEILSIPEYVLTSLMSTTNVLRCKQIITRQIKKIKGFKEQTDLTIVKNSVIQYKLHEIESCIEKGCKYTIEKDLNVLCKYCIECYLNCTIKTVKILN